MKSPYTPTEPISNFDDLMGRETETRKLIQYLDSKRSIVISGDRGIGKTSLLLAIKNAILKNSINEFENIDIITCFLSCNSRETEASIVDSIIRSLQIQTKIDLVGIESNTHSVTLKSALIHGQFKTDSKGTESKSSSFALINAIRTIVCTKKYKNHKIIIMLDEIDQILESVDIGILVRTTKETLISEQIDCISFILCGQRDTVPKLNRNHPSISRIFEKIWLEHLTELQCMDIIGWGEKRSNIIFDPEIKSSIAKSSRGFPAVTHRLADSCVLMDKDKYIDILDFEAGLADAVIQIKGEESLNAVTMASGELGSAIMSYLSSESNFVSQSALLEAFHNPEETIISTLNVLIKSGFLEAEDDSFRIMDRLFSAYIELDSMRTRDLENIRKIAQILEKDKWVVRAVNINEHRNIDLIATRKGWFFERKIGLIHLGSIDRLGLTGIRKLSMKFTNTINEYSLKELILVGEGIPKQTVLAEINKEKNVSYIPVNLMASM